LQPGFQSEITNYQLQIANHLNSTRTATVPALASCMYVILGFIPLLSFRSGVLVAAAMDNFHIQEALLSILWAMFMLPIQGILASRSFLVTAHS
jgi:hypothetical protein